MTDERPTPETLPDVDATYERTGISDTEVYQGELAAEGAAADRETIQDPLLTLELRPDETADPNVAAEEGVPYVPPVDPVVSGTQEDGDPIVASGFASSALEVPYDEDHHGSWELDEGEVAARIRDALRADAETTGLADEIAIAVIGDRAVLTGRVEDLEDADAVVAVAERASGIGEVVDRLEVASVETTGLDPRGDAPAED